MKQINNLAGRWIDSSLLRAFVHITREADQTQIILCRWASCCFRDNMINVHPQSAVFFRCQTVGAAIFIALID